MRCLLPVLLLVACKGAPAPGSDPAGDDSDSDVAQEDTDDTDVTATTDADGDGWPAGDDCDDADPDVHPEAAEGLCASRDLDCDGAFVPGPFVVDGAASSDTLEDALLSVTAGGTIDVCPGVWSTNATFYAPTDDLVTIRAVSGSSDDTILDGGWNGRVLGLVGGTVALRDLTIRYGQPGQQDPLGSMGGGVAAVGARLSISGCDVHDDRAIEGGGVAFEVVDPTTDVLAVEDTVFEHDLAVATEHTTAYGGGLYVLSSSSDARVSIRGSTFEDDLTVDTGPDNAGGALAIAALGEALVTLTDDRFAANAYGAVWMDARDLSVDADGCDWVDNSGASVFHANAVARVTLTATTFERTVADWRYDSDTAGALSIDGPKVSATLDGVTFADNGEGEGGALTVSGENVTFDANASLWDGNEGFESGGVLIDVDGNLAKNVGSVAVTDSTFTGNSGTFGGGLNVWADDGDVTMALDTVTFDANTATEGGAVNLNARTASATFTDVTATGNHASEGGVVYVTGGSPAVTIVGGTFTGNTAYEGGGLAGSGAGSVTVSGADFGTGALDNIPDDANGCGSAYAAGASFTWYAGSQSCY